MLKRVLWLSLAAAAGWLLWSVWRQRQEVFGSTSPQLASLEPFRDLISPPASRHPAQPHPAQEVAGPTLVREALAGETAPTQAAPEAGDLQHGETVPDQAVPEAAAPQHGEIRLEGSISTSEADTPEHREMAPEENTPESGVQGLGEPAAPTSDEIGEVVGYCPRCKTKRLIDNPHQETTESGRRAARGTCPVCGGRMFAFLPNRMNG
jgi:hypothetical protein